MLLVLRSYALMTVSIKFFHIQLVKKIEKKNHGKRLLIVPAYETIFRKSRCYS